MNHDYRNGGSENMFNHKKKQLETKIYQLAFQADLPCRLQTNLTRSHLLAKTDSDQPRSIKHEPMVFLIKSTQCFDQSLPPSFMKCCVTSMRHSTCCRRRPCMHAYTHWTMSCEYCSIVYRRVVQTSPLGSETANLFRAVMKCEQFVAARSRGTCLLYCNLN